METWSTVGACFRSVVISFYKNDVLPYLTEEKFANDTESIISENNKDELIDSFKTDADKFS